MGLKFGVVVAFNSATGEGLIKEIPDGQHEIHLSTAELGDPREKTPGQEEKNGWYLFRFENGCKTLLTPDGKTRFLRRPFRGIPRVGFKLAFLVDFKSTRQQPLAYKWGPQMKIRRALVQREFETARKAVTQKKKLRRLARLTRRNGAGFLGRPTRAA